MLRGTLPESEDMSGQPSLNTIESAREAVSSSKYTEALNLLDELEDSGFVDAELYLLRGISFAQVGKAEAATESLKKAAKANPSVVTFYNLAVHLSNIGESADALAVAQNATCACILGLLPDIERWSANHTSIRYCQTEMGAAMRSGL